MRRALALALLAVAVIGSDAEAARRVATTSEGVRMTLDGRSFTIRVPQTWKPGARLFARCGGARSFARASGRARPRRTLRLRLRGALRSPEWCDYTASSSSPGFETAGAARLRPLRSPAPAAVTPGQTGIRAGIDEVFREFALRGRVLTVRLSDPTPESGVFHLTCIPTTESPGLEDIASRYVAIDGDSTEVTARLVGGDISNVDACLIEGPPWLPAGSGQATLLPRKA